MNDQIRDRELGLNRRITRRDFFDGVRLAVGATAVAHGAAHGQTLAIPPSNPSYYPPTLGGLRGSHAGSFEVAHAARDGKTWDEATEENDSYDLIVVGGGISGLAAAFFYRKYAGNHARILILENHDDFGGHAKRNEFRSGNRLLLGYGGTQSIEGPSRYSAEAKGLLQELGI